MDAVRPSGNGGGCCADGNQLDIELDPAEDASALLGRRRSLARIDRKRAQTVRASHHHLRIPKWSPHGTELRFLHPLRRVEKSRGLGQQFGHGVVALLEEGIGQQIVIHLLCKEFAADCNRWKMWKPGPEHREQFKSVHVGHTQVGNHQIRHLRLHLSQGSKAIFGNIDGIALLFKNRF